METDPPQWFIIGCMCFLGLLVLCGIGSGIFLFVRIVNYYLGG